MCQAKDLPDPGLGEAGREAGPAHRRPGGLLARRGPRPRRPADRQGASATCGPRHRRPADRDHVARRGRRSSRSSGSAAARTPSRSPATCCATTSPTCSRSSSSAPAPRCSRSCPLMNGGGLFETGAGGSAPKHVQQLVKENHLRWDSPRRVPRAGQLASSTSPRPPATPRPRSWPTPSTRPPGRLLEENKSPSRKVGEIDNRGSHVYLARFWAEALAAPDRGPRRWPSASPPWPRLAGRARRRSSRELIAVQGRPADIGGYYRPDEVLTTAVMRPSTTFNETLASLG